MNTQTLYFTLADVPKTLVRIYNDIENLKNKINELSQQTNKGNAILNREEAADLLNISLPTLTKLTKEGKFIWYRNKNKIFYNYFSLVEFIEIKQKKTRQLNLKGVNPNGLSNEDC
jgi:hypothetical protein